MPSVLPLSRKKKRLDFSDLGELDKSLCSVKTPLRVWKSLSTQYIPFQSTRCSRLCLTLIKHNHQAMGARVCVCVWRAHTDTHTHKEHLPVYLPCASRANHSRELETQLMTYIQHLQDVRKKETQLHICTLKAVLYGMSVCVCAAMVLAYI